jgi:hypothetical protein
MKGDRERTRRDARIHELWRRGFPVEAIGALVGLGAKRVYEICAQCPGPRPEVRRCVNDARRRKRREAYNKARREARKAARDAEIRRLWSAGMPGRKLARRFRVAPSTVSTLVADLRRPRRFGDPEEVAWPLPRRSAPAESPRPARPRRPVEPLPPYKPGGPRGSASGRSKLTEAKVEEMKRLRSDGWSTGRLAKHFQVARNTVAYALNGTTWSEAKG